MHCIYAAIRLTWILLLADIGLAANSRDRYSQLVFRFDRPISYQYRYDLSANSITLEFQSVTASLLTAAHTYDETLVRRVLIREFEPGQTHVTLVFRDDDVRATVSKFAEPFRVIVDIFDRYFEEKRDPATGMPQLTSSGRNPDARPVAARPSGLKDTGGGMAARMPRPLQTRSQKSSGESKRKLLQPQTPAYRNSDQLKNLLASIPPGIGRGWAGYPIYIYRVQTELYKVDKNYESWIAKNTKRAMSSGEAMSDYAEKLFDFGHEGRALMAFQQVLHKNPGVFDAKASPLWKLAEIHLGRENYILARGYYQALLSKHSDSPLAQFSKLRLLDIKALEKNKVFDNNFQDLLKTLAAIETKNHPELTAMISIRKAYWSSNKTKADELPAINSNILAELRASESVVQGQKTAFILKSLILNNLVAAQRNWRRETGNYADAYLKKYRGQAASPIRSRLLSQAKKRVKTTIEQENTKKQYHQAINIYESLPSSLKEIRNDYATALAIAESYRKIGSAIKSYPYYLLAKQHTSKSPEIFQTSFWAAMMLGEVLSNQSLIKSSDFQSGKMKRQIADADTAMERSWSDLKMPEKKILFSGLQSDLEKSVRSSQLLKTPANIVLEAWEKYLVPSSSGTTKAEGVNSSFPPSRPTVILLRDLALKFSRLGSKKKKIATLDLLKRIKPGDFKNEKQASSLWANKLVELAENYRRSNQYLKAGRTYAFVGKESIDWDDKAEALYKGGLLLFRAGRRDEAVQAFTQASQDNNNLLYADLAKRRLDQFEN